MSRAFDIQHTEEVERSILAEQKRISRLLIPFVTSPAPGQTLSGVFFTGDRPCWILSTDKGGVKVFPSGHSVVHGFTATSMWGSKGDFLLNYEEARTWFYSSSHDHSLCSQGSALMEWIPGIQLDNHLPSRSVPRQRPCTNVVYDSSTSLVVAASSQLSKFASYDEDGNIVWEPDGT